jgi:hypothetical protein
VVQHGKFHLGDCDLAAGQRPAQLSSARLRLIRTKKKKVTLIVWRCDDGRLLHSIQRLDLHRLCENNFQKPV